MVTPVERDVHDVAVVGFGPTGAVLAALLGQAGLRCWVGDRSTEVYDKPRAISLDHEILRIFQQIGIVDEVLQHVEPFTPSEYLGADGRLIKRLTMIEPPYPLGYTPSNVFTQPPVEAALRRRVAALPTVQVRLGVEVTGVEADEHAVRLSLREADGTTSCVRARHLIGCDGARSLVREAAGIDLDDLQFDEPWLVVDVLVNDTGLARLPLTSVQYCDPQRPATLVIGPGRHRRWEISLKPGEDPALAATPERTWELLAPWLTPADGTLWRQASYRFHALVAQRWRAGRVFIAGDAAHQQPPFLGQGMCQGIRDAANLAWKLAAVVKGEVEGAAADRLLDSYGEERRAHVCELTARIKQIGALICERDPVRARERDERLLAEAGGQVRDTPRQDVIPPLQNGLIAADGQRANGTLFPQPWLVRSDDGRRRRFDADEVAGTGWRLVLAAGQPAPAAHALPPALADLRCIELGADWHELDGVAASWFRRAEACAALVRPDHCVYGVASTAQQIDALLQDAARQLT